MTYLVDLVRPGRCLKAALKLTVTDGDPAMSIKPKHDPSLESVTKDSLKPDLGKLK